jgi:outer membrane protein assembly factor BamB/tRNA A-37 threonylcarbamoyl transferase component Bud32
MKDTSSKRPEDNLGSSSRDGSVDGSSESLGTRPVGGGSPLDLNRSARLAAGDRSLRHEGRLAPDTVLQSRYRIIEVIGAGGMSTVYKAQDTRFAQVTRLCAVKEMSNTASSAQIRERNLRNFEREASILATLSHPAVPQVYDYFSEGMQSYLVQEYIRGRDLESWLDSLDGFPTESQVVRWALQICDVLIYLHDHEPHPIVFRDMKPSNIMVDERGRIRLVDFGIAKVFQSGLKGTMIGTEGYSPPEQYRGVADPRGDIYSLGATLHHLLSRQDPRLEPPFSFQERPVQAANPNVSDEMAAVIEQALAYDISERFSSVREMKAALSKLKVARADELTHVPAGLDENGGPAPVWEFVCEDEVRSSPAVQNGIVYIGAYDNNLYALDGATGEFRWKYAAEGGIGSSPCVADGRVFVGSQDWSLYALNAETGHLLWTCPTQGPIYSSPRAQFGHVFFGSDDRHLYGVKLSSGRVIWSFEAEAPVRSSPALGPKAIYVGDEAGSVYAVGADGQILWRFRTRRAVTSSPLLVGDTLYVGSRDGYLYALDIQNGWDVWRYRTGGPIISSPDADDSAVFFGSADGDVYAVHMASGRAIWRYGTEGQVTSSPLVHEGVVYVGSSDGSLYAIDATTGKLRWRFRTDGPVVSSPCTAADRVYFGSSDHRVYALPV